MWKSTSFEKVSLLKKYLFRKSCCFIEKYLLQKINSSVYIFILNKFLHQESSCSEKVVFLKNYLFWRTGCPVEVSLWKSSYSKNKKKNCRKEAILLEKELPKKVTALKKWLLRKSNCCVEVVTPKKCEEVASPKIKLS